MQSTNYAQWYTNYLAEIFNYPHQGFFGATQAEQEIKNINMEKIYDA